MTRLGLSVSIVGLLLAREAVALNIALEDGSTAAAHCQKAPNDVNAKVVQVLQAQGHTVTVVDGSGIDTAPEIAAYDVVLFGSGGFDCGWDWLQFDPVIKSYVEGGGGLVVTGWAAFFIANNPRMESYPNLADTLPMTASTAAPSGGTAIMVAGHPITDGVGDFDIGAGTYNSHGAGVKTGATTLFNIGGVPSGAAWTVGTGRAVYLGPIYLANYGGYTNESLLDGTVPPSVQLFNQAIEWAAGGFCGDSITEQPREQCDDGNSEPRDDCNACKTAVCGDGVVHDLAAGAEQCDDGTANSDSAPDACRTDCEPARCGDNVVDTGEVCDGDDRCGDDCQLETIQGCSCSSGDAGLPWLLLLGVAFLLRRKR
jgi:MYXO-CTERM domain-containing protein